MSREVNVQFEVRNMLIMKDTLNQLGYDFNESKNNILEISRPWHPIRINGNTGSISYDEYHVSEVNKIKQTYMVNFYKDQAIREGNQVEEKVEANGEIIINIIR